MSIKLLKKALLSCLPVAERCFHHAAVIVEYAQFSTLLLSLLVVVGLAALYFGGDWLTEGAAGLALALNISPLVVGLTIVSMATSAPELFTSLLSAARGSPGLALGNIVGSNIANIGLILGFAAVLWPFQVSLRLIIGETPVLLGLSILFVFLCVGGLVRWEGALLLVCMFIYLVILIRMARRSRDREIQHYDAEVVEGARPLGMSALLFLAGCLLLGVGAEVLVSSSTILAQRMGVSDVLIGITIVAVGTSLPELATTIAAATKKHTDIVAGNIVGSNLFNLLFIGGMVAATYGLPVEQSLFRFEFPAMLVLTVILWIVFYTRRRVTRLEGIILLASYVAIILVSSLSQFGLLNGSL